MYILSNLSFDACDTRIHKYIYMYIHISILCPIYQFNGFVQQTLFHFGDGKFELNGESCDSMHFSLSQEKATVHTQLLIIGMDDFFKPQWHNEIM